MATIDRRCDTTLSVRLRSNDKSLDRLILREPRSVHCSPSFEEFVEAMSGNITVKVVFVGELVVQTLEEDKLCTLLEKLGCLTALENLEIALPHLGAKKRITASSVVRFLGRAKALKTFVLWPFLRIDSGEDAKLIACVLKDHLNLLHFGFMHLVMSGGSRGIVIDPILRSLATVPKLETLQISAAFSMQEGRQAVREESSLTNLLMPSCALKYFALRNLNLGDSHCTAIANMLSKYGSVCSLKLLDLRFNSITEKGFTALLATLQENYILEWLETDCRNKNWLEKISFALALNRAGRFALLRDPSTSRQEMMGVFEKCCDNLNVSYHLLRHNPSICDRGKDKVENGFTPASQT
jgi:hypothetical protein